MSGLTKFCGNVCQIPIQVKITIRFGLQKIGHYMH